MKDYEKKEFESSDDFIIYVLHSHTNNMFIHNLFGCLTPSQTIYTKPLFGTLTLTWYSHTVAHLRTHSSHTYTLSVDIHSVHDTCILYTMDRRH